ncbi:hypothetical protein GGR54DRAFT_637729 [Hypoxylon sp. NC1633]|nr:hypothetical protein GGR54DRAFT_637729 [Hypoxylon sp. NC1633]
MSKTKKMTWSAQVVRIVPMDHLCRGKRSIGGSDREPVQKGEDVVSKRGNKNTILNVEQIERIIPRLIHQQSGIKVPGAEDDLFAVGINSLRAA